MKKTTEEMMTMLKENGINIDNFYGTINVVERTTSVKSDKRVIDKRFLNANDNQEKQFVHVMRILTNKFYSKEKGRWLSGMNAFVRENMTGEEIFRWAQLNMSNDRNLRLSKQQYFTNDYLLHLINPFVESTIYSMSAPYAMGVVVNGKVDWDAFNKEKISEDTMDRYKGDLCDQVLCTLYNRYFNLLNDPEGKYTKEEVTKKIKEGLDEGKYYMAYKILNDMLKEGVICFED